MKLSREEVLTLQVLRLKCETNQAIADRLGIIEEAVQYHLKRQTEQASDGRGKLSFIEQVQLVEVVDHWWSNQVESLRGDRSPDVHQLRSCLVDEYGYGGSHKSVRNRHQSQAGRSCSAQQLVFEMPDRMKKASRELIPTGCDFSRSHVWQISHRSRRRPSPF